MHNRQDNKSCPIGIIVQKILKARPKSVVSAKNRTNKKNLHLLSSHFISETWKLMIQNGLEQKIIYSLKTYPQEFDTFEEYILHLNKRNPCFGWAWIRARIEEQVEKSLDDVLETVISNHPVESKKYQSLLLKNGFYWFRQSIRHHLRLGYHTAVSVIIKFIGTYKYQSKEKFDLIPLEYKNSIYAACKTFAAFDLELLLASDKALWDSAAATSYAEYKIENDQLYLPEKLINNVIDNLSARADTNKKIINEPILGCPALKAEVKIDGISTPLPSVFEDFYCLILKIVEYNKSNSE